jgi:uncharacterized membrane protein YgcG
MEEPQQQEEAAAPPPHQANKFFQLPEFWETDPVAWFAIAESIFLMRAVTDEEMKYAAVVTALPKNTVRHVKPLLINKPANPYTAIKAKLLGAHERSEFQRCETLMDMPPLGDRKPSEYMAAMAELAPPDIAANGFFGAVFLRKLPDDLRIHLADCDIRNHDDLAARADRLWSHRPRTGLVAAATAEDVEDGVAAVSGSKWSQQKSKKKKGGQGGGGGAKSNNNGGASGGGGKNTPGDSARVAAGLCKSHWVYGEQAWSCGEPNTCKWQGN